MPPKEARENNPDIIPTTEQMAIIKAWADSFVRLDISNYCRQSQCRKES